MIVIYYITSCYFDSELETIQSIKKTVELHIIIEIAPESRKTNIIEIESLDGLNNIEDCEKVLGEKKWQLFKKYFSGVSSVVFVVHKSKKSFSLPSFYTSHIAGKHIRKINPDVIHFDSVSTRLVGLIPVIRGRKTFITVHDPLPHTGEGSLKLRLVETYFYRHANGLFFYSKFAGNQFENSFRSISANLNFIRFQPFSFISQFVDNQKSQEPVILFFGRILKYKGVDLLLDAIPAVLEKYPNQKFVIAGKSFGYELDYDLIKRYEDNIQLISQHLDIIELSMLIKKSSFIVCPYRDATQSGVLMTANALGKMVLGSNVGAFPEYIIDFENGLLAEPDSSSIANKIIEALNDDNYKKIEKRITSRFSELTGSYNEESLMKAYEFQ